ncbi:MAG: crotonyl-CoA carboxylase/reductase [Flavobacteriales bacterium]|jgi:crotonyl-CoA carboxylase/reductase|nr:crotonyl-CoA carboxylase/reductase [Flavobacteriales bacterium]MCI1752929.1 crotonyl-CoA carboxylase/reductase [Flavobacteriales bacterium]
MSERINFGKLPPLGTVPERMWAQVVRKERYGEPIGAFAMEEVPVPTLEKNEVLVGVMAAGLNHNSVWAARGFPLDLIEYMKLRNGSDLDWHIIGSDCSGIVYAVGSGVTNVKVGDEVVVQPGWVEDEDPWVMRGKPDTAIAPSARAWGFETNHGSYAQFCKVKSRQCLPKPKRLSWEEAAVYMLSGVTSYCMLYKYPPNTVKKGDVVLIWGGSGGLGVTAIQLVLMGGGIPVAVVSNAERAAFCQSLGALTLNRSEFKHWGALTKADVMPETQDRWVKAVRPFEKALKELTGGKMPAIVLEHPGEDTMPTSIRVCNGDGMVVICAGTSGYLATLDLRFLWLRRKRLQGSHFGELDHCREYNDLIANGTLSPVLAHTYAFEEVPLAVQRMADNTHPPGNCAVSIGSAYV